MRVVPFPVPGSASSGTVVFRVPYWNWTLYAWSHFRYRALPVPVRLCLETVLELDSMRVVPFPVSSYAISGTVVFSVPSRTRTGLYARGPISSTGLCQFRCGCFLGPVLDWAMCGG
jgi:hypothetical protein